MTVAPDVKNALLDTAVKCQTEYTTAIFCPSPMALLVPCTHVSPGLNCSDPRYFCSPQQIVLSNRRKNV